MFRSDKKLKEHLRCHEQGPADILCQVCGRKFPSQSHLKLHMRVHLEKKFACDQCPKKYPRKAMLDKHLQVHAGDRRFQCAHCPKAYFMVKTLQEHMNSVHLNIRPFTCPHCPKSYASSGARYLHVQLKHKSLAAPANNREHAKEGA
ncbi:unnamed protein product [Cyprideis torosa]|nr:unnamed protein product [Cyprideis torosa]CAG0908145.1 unnamed protein product [Cyprideis torosa]